MQEFKGKQTFVIGGRHTKCAAVRYIEFMGDKIFRDCGMYVKWPSTGVFLPGDWKDEKFLFPLICAGTKDNQILQLPMTFVDRCLSARRLFTFMFPKLEDYTNANQERKSNFGRQIQVSLGVAHQTSGSFRSLVAVDEAVWPLFLSILNNDYIKAEEVEKARKAKKSYKPKKGAAAQSNAPLNHFIGLPTNVVVPLLQKVTTGQLPLKTAQLEALHLKCYFKLVTAFESAANYGKDKNHPDYISYSTFRENFPLLAESFEGTEITRFSIKNRTPMDDNMFQLAVEQLLQAAEMGEAKQEPRMADTLRGLLNPSVADVSEKVVHIETTQGQLLALNCQTEDVVNYFKSSVRLKIGMILSIFWMFVYIAEFQCNFIKLRWNSAMF